MMLNPQRPNRLTRFAPHVCGSLTLGIATTVLCGWLFRIEPLKRFVPGFVSMNPVTACCLLAAGLSLILLSQRSPSGIRAQLGQTLAGAILLTGLLRLCSISFGWHLRIDQWLFTSELTGGNEPPSRIALRTAINLALAGAALLLLDVRIRRGRRPTEFLCAASAVIAFLALIGYSYGLFMYYRAPDFVPMSLPGAIAFLLLATGTLLARPDEGVMRIVTSNAPSGLLLRLLLPLGVLLPPLLGALRIGGENAGWYSTRAGVALFATSFIVLFFASVGWTTRLLFRAETERSAAVERVRLLNAELEQRVADRTAELHSSNEDLRQASHAKDNFLAALSHELRTPLTPVLMTAASLERDLRISPEYREQLSMMRRNIELEARLIDDLLDLTRISHGKLELQVGAANVHTLLAHTEEIVRSTAQVKGIDLRFELHAAHHNVAGDAARLHQVFWNVLKNAIKFTPSGGRIIVRTTNPLEGGVRLEVRDSGVGIDPALLPGIFTAFVQEGSSRGRTNGGLGLGLSIAKSIVELHGGTISANSAGTGEGATFIIDLATTNPLPAAHASEQGAAPAGPRPYRLLVVEDHEPTRDVLARLLRRQGHEVTTADCVETALTAAAQSRFDLVISDLGLPDGNGVDLMVKLTRDYGLRGIALSGYGMDEDLVRTKNAGFIAHLVKPIDFERLNHVLEQVARAA